MGELVKRSRYFVPIIINEITTLRSITVRTLYENLFVIVGNITTEKKRREMAGGKKDENKGDNEEGAITEGLL